MALDCTSDPNQVQPIATFTGLERGSAITPDAQWKLAALDQLVDGPLKGRRDPSLAAH